MNYLKKCILLAFVVSSAMVYRGCAEGGATGSSGILVTTDWLQDHLNDPNAVVLHSGTEEGYDSLHIPGARFIDPYDFTIGSEMLSNEMPPADSILALLREAGVNSDSRIILYYESSRLLTRTARVFVSLDHAGLGSQTFVLNGGLPAWEEEELETSDVTPDFSPGQLERFSLKDVVISAAELDQERWDPEIVVMDVRTDEEYHGSQATEEEPADGGHIEGAYSLPYQELLLSEKPYLFKPDIELKDLFHKSGMDPGKETVVYCGSGVRASVSYLVARHLGYPVILYDGSFQEWDKQDMPLTGPVAIPESNL